MAVSSISNQTTDRQISERKIQMETRHIQEPKARTSAPVASRTPNRSAEPPKEKSIEFELNMPQAKSAAIAGTFNNWDLKKTPMRKDRAAGWKATIALPPGRHEYRFVIDGQWISDPNAKESVQNAYGGTNSV